MVHSSDGMVVRITSSYAIIAHCLYGLIAVMWPTNSWYYIIIWSGAKYKFPQVNPLEDLNNMYSTMQLPKITIPSERGLQFLNNGDEVCVAHLFSFLCCVFCFVCARLCLMHPMLPISLGCPFWIAPSVFSNVYIILCKASF